jgi:hypothetical protein
MHLHFSLKKEVTKMMAEQYDPADITPFTIKNLFYNQIRSLSLRASTDERLRTFDLQFSDSWF